MCREIPENVSLLSQRFFLELRWPLRFWKAAHKFDKRLHPSLRWSSQTRSRIQKAVNNQTEYGNCAVHLR